MRLTPAVCLACLLGAAVPGMAAWPRLRVKGRPELLLEATRRDKGATIVEGRLSDSAVGAGLEKRTVLIRLTDGEKGSTTMQSALDTGAEGRFRINAPVCGVRCWITLRFGGDALYASARYGPTLVHVSKPTVQIELLVPDRLDAADPTQRITLTTRAGGRGVSLPLVVYAGARPIHWARTDTAGTVEVPLPTSALWPPGPKTIRAEFSGDARFNAGARSRKTLLTTPVRVTLVTDKGRVARSEQVRLRGRVQDLRGAVGGAAVSIFVHEQRVARVRADRDGRFAVALAAQRYAPGELELTARFTPDVAWRRAARSPRRYVAVAPLVPPSPRLYLISLAATVALIGVLALLRLRANGSASPAAGGASRASARQGPSATTSRPLRSGVRLGRRQALLRNDFGLSGLVRDASDGKPVGSAQLSLSGSGLRRMATSGPDGRFGFEQLPAGELLLAVACPGYVSERVRIALPHRGQLREMRFDIVPIRVRVLEIYRDATRPFLPDRQCWARWTPRELLDHLEGRADVGHEALSELSSLLERTYWSAETPRAETLRLAVQAAARVELPRPKSSGTPGEA